MSFYGWLIVQELWIEPILKVLAGFALIKYIIFGITKIEEEVGDNT